MTRRSPRRCGDLWGGRLEPLLVAEVGGDHRRIALHLGRRALGDLDAEVEDQHAVGDVHHETHVVLDEEDGDPQLLADVEDEPGHVLGLLEVHPGDRLVEEQQLGVHRQRPPELDALLDAVRQQGDRILAPLLDLEEVDDVLDPLAVGDLFASCRTEPHRAGEERAAHA